MSDESWYLVIAEEPGRCAGRSVRLPMRLLMSLDGDQNVSLAVVLVHPPPV